MGVRCPCHPMPTITLLHGGLCPSVPSEQLNGAAGLWGEGAGSCGAQRGTGQHPPLPVAEKSQQQEAGTEEHEATDEQHH